MFQERMFASIVELYARATGQYVSQNDLSRRSKAVYAVSNDPVLKMLRQRGTAFKVEQNRVSEIASRFDLKCNILPEEPIRVYINTPGITVEGEGGIEIFRDGKS